MTPTDNSPMAKPATPSAAPWLACYAVLGLVLVCGLWVRSQRRAVVDAVGGEETPATATSLRIDPNTADWRDLTLLPGIGETMARRIVDYREARRAEGEPESTVFARLEDLDAVRGLGPKRLAAMADLLVFPAAD